MILRRPILVILFVNATLLLGACSRSDNDSQAQNDSLNTIKTTSRDTSCLSGDDGETLYILQKNKYSKIGTVQCSGDELSFSFSKGSITVAPISETLESASLTQMSQIEQAKWTVDKDDNQDELAKMTSGRVYFFKRTQPSSNGHPAFQASGAMKITKTPNPNDKKDNLQDDFILKIEYKFFEIKS